MVLSKAILILEDDLRALSKLLEKLHRLEQDQPYDFELMVLTNPTQVEEYINRNPNAKFDVILIDRDSKFDKGSFHILDFDKFDLNTIISISSVPGYNEELLKKGIRKTVLKNYSELDVFAEKVTEEVGKMIRKPVKVLFK